MDPVNNTYRTNNFEQPVCPAFPEVDFEKAAELQKTIRISEKVLGQTQDKIRELQAALQRETGDFPTQFTATHIETSGRTPYAANPNKTYAELMNEMSEEATKSKRGARADARLILQLQDELRKEEEISNYLNSLRDQASQAQIKAAQNSASRSSEGSSLESFASFISLVAATHFLVYGGAASAIVGGVLSYKLAKLIGRSVDEFATTVSNSVNSSSYRTPEYRYAYGA